jgi:D-lactate dehydrogenase (cytochrome)
MKDASKLGIFHSIVGHVGDGNFHHALFYDPSDPKQRESVSQFVHTMIGRAVQMEGTVSVGSKPLVSIESSCLIRRRASMLLEWAKRYFASSWT